MDKRQIKLFIDKCHKKESTGCISTSVLNALWNYNKVRRRQTMKVLIYHNHHHLPFWHKPANPDCIYVPGMLEGWMYNPASWKETEPFYEFQMIPVLNALHQLEIPGIMAHVSVIFDAEKKMVSSAHRCWVQFSTEPMENDPNTGIPIVVKDGKVTVHSVLTQADGYWPHDYYLGDAKLKCPGPTDPGAVGFWKDAFTKRLREEKTRQSEEAFDQFARAQAVLSFWQGINLPGD